MPGELREDAQEVIEKQGWNDDAVLLYLSRFLKERGLSSKFTEYLKKRAAEESGEEISDDPEVICSVCGSDNVSYAMWVNAKTGETGGVFGTWNYGDNHHCNECDEGHKLLVSGVDGDRFKEMWKKFKETRP